MAGNQITFQMLCTRSCLYPNSKTYQPYGAAGKRSHTTDSLIVPTRILDAVLRCTCQKEQQFLSTICEQKSDFEIGKQSLTDFIASSRVFNLFSPQLSKQRERTCVWNALTVRHMWRKWAQQLCALHHKRNYAFSFHCQERKTCTSVMIPTISTQRSFKRNTGVTFWC